MEVSPTLTVIMEKNKLKSTGHLRIEQKKNVVDNILSQILNGKGRYISSPVDMTALEKKHIKFMGKTFVKELIEDRVEYDYQHGGWDFPNNYSGDLK